MSKNLFKADLYISVHSAYDDLRNFSELSKKHPIRTAGRENHVYDLEEHESKVSSVIPFLRPVASRKGFSHHFALLSFQFQMTNGSLSLL